MEINRYGVLTLIDPEIKQDLNTLSKRLTEIRGSL